MAKKKKVDSATIKAAHQNIVKKVKEFFRLVGLRIKAGFKTLVKLNESMLKSIKNLKKLAVTMGIYLLSVAFMPFFVEMSYYLVMHMLFTPRNYDHPFIDLLYALGMQVIYMLIGLTVLPVLWLGYLGIYDFVNSVIFKEETFFAVEGE